MSFDSDNDLYHRMHRRWYDKAKKRAMTNPEYASIEERRGADGMTFLSDDLTMDDWEKQRQIMHDMTRTPLYLTALAKWSHANWNKPSHWRARRVFRKQRIERGYASRDLWNFDAFLASVCIPAFRELADIAHGWPGEPMTFEEWQGILREIADGFEAKRQQPHIEYDTIEQYQDEYARLQGKWVSAMDLFTKHYQHFWD